jgi:hypothetical protein
MAFDYLHTATGTMSAEHRFTDVTTGICSHSSTSHKASNALLDTSRYISFNWVKRKSGSVLKLHRCGVICPNVNSELTPDELLPLFERFAGKVGV